MQVETCSKKMLKKERKKKETSKSHTRTYLMYFQTVLSFLKRNSAFENVLFACNAQHAFHVLLQFVDCQYWIFDVEKLLENTNQEEK